MKEQYTPLSVTQADMVLVIVTESWQDIKLTSANDARRTSDRARVSNPPEVAKCSCTGAVDKQLINFNQFKCIFFCFNLDVLPKYIHI